MALGAKKLGDLVISLKGDTKQFNKSMDGAKKGMGGLKSSLKAALPAIGAITAAVGVASVAITKVMKETVRYGTEVDKMTKQADISAEAFTRMAYAAKQEHASMETLGKSLQLLPKYMQYAKDGMATYQREFDRMGVSVTNADGSLKSAMDVMMEMSDYMADDAIPKTEKTATAMTLLGRRGAEMVPFLSLGRDKIAALGDEAEKLGLVISDLEARKLKKFDDMITRMQESVKGLKIQIGLHLLPEIQNWTHGIELLMQAWTKFRATTKEPLQDHSNAIANITEQIARMEARQQTLRDSTRDIISLTEVRVRQMTDKEQTAYDNLTRVIERKKLKLAELKGEQQAGTESIKEFITWKQRAKELEAENTSELSKLTKAMFDMSGATKMVNADLKQVDVVAPKVGEQMAEIGALCSLSASQVLNLAHSFDNLFSMFSEEGGFSLSRFLKALSGILMMIPGGQGLGAGLGLAGVGAGMFGMAQGGLLIPAAQGIMVDRPTPILAGEGGQTEIVSPIDKFFDLVKGMQPNIVVKTGDPSTYVEFVEGLSAGNKDRLWRGSMRGAQARDLAR